MSAVSWTNDHNPFGGFVLPPSSAILSTTRTLRMNGKLEFFLQTPFQIERQKLGEMVIATLSCLQSQIENHPRLSKKPIKITVRSLCEQEVSSIGGTCKDRTAMICCTCLEAQSSVNIIIWRKNGYYGEVPSKKHDRKPLKSDFNNLAILLSGQAINDLAEKVP